MEPITDTVVFFDTKTANNMLMLHNETSDDNLHTWV